MAEEVREFGGYEADDYYCTNAVTISLGESINGSGPEAFNGAKSWPTLWLEIPFEVGDEEKMEALASRFEMILRDAGIICEEDDHWLWDHCPGCGKGDWKNGFCAEYKKRQNDSGCSPHW